jgi:AhpD family alkylhydroperoxidase
MAARRTGRRARSAYQAIVTKEQQMGRFEPVSEPKGKAKKMFAALTEKMGCVPKVYALMGRNPAFMDAMMQCSQAAGKGLDAKTKELICIAVSAANNCQYCIDAHMAIGEKVGVTSDEAYAAIEVAAAMTAYNIFNHGADPENDFAK